MLDADGATGADTSELPLPFPPLGSETSGMADSASCRRCRYSASCLSNPFSTAPCYASCELIDSIASAALTHVSSTHAVTAPTFRATASHWRTNVDLPTPEGPQTWNKNSEPLPISAPRLLRNAAISP